MTNRTVEDFFNTEYLDYAHYTIANRAIPSMVDGFKPSQRKIAFAANILWSGGNEKPMKVFQLGGQAAALSFFHHGSLDQTIITMTQDFKNSMSIFKGIGQFGSLRAPESGAPRYVGVKFNSNFRLLYKDFELLTPQFEEGEEIEPEWFLPIIPTILLNGGSGIAVGFATKLLTRHPTDLGDACIEVLGAGKCTGDLKPWVKGFNGTVELLDGTEKSWVFRGLYEVRNTTTVVVTEIPPSYTYEKYEKVLDALCEKGDLVSYDDNSSDKIHYTLKFRRRDLAKWEKKKLPVMLKMREQETENLTCLDEDRRLIVFDRSTDLVEAFVAFRLGYYKKRKIFLLKTLDQELETLSSRALFIKSVIEGDLVVHNKAKKDIVVRLRELNIKSQRGSFDYLLAMPIYSLTKEKYEALLLKSQKKTEERDQIAATGHKEMYLVDLSSLKKHLKKTQVKPARKVSKKKATPKAKPTATKDSDSEYFNLF